MTLTPLARQSKPGSEAYNGERLFNYYARQSDSASPLVLISRGGMVEHADLGTFSEVRAVTKMGGAIYAVSGGAVWKVSGGTATNVGTVLDGETSMAANRSQVAIVAGGNYYVCDGTSTTQYTAGAITSALRLAEADGYMIVIGTGAGFADTIQISAVNDATTFDALDFAVAEYQPDALVGIIHDHKQLYLFGTDTTEVFYNSGDALFPFTPNPSAVVEHGCKNGATIAKADNAVFWVRQDGAVVRNYGGTPEVISTPEIKAVVSAETVTGGFTFSENGHEFYAVTVTGKPTMVYDITSGLWHERVKGLGYAPWAARCRVQLGGVDYFGTDDGRIATLSSSVYADFGEVMLGEFVTPLVVNGGNRFRVTKVHINIDGGDVASTTTPRVMLQTSNDGRTWSREKWRDLADLGEYSKRATWHGLGQFRQGKLRCRITDPVPRGVIGGEVTYG